MKSFKRVRDSVEKAFLRNPAVVAGRVFPEGIKVTKSLTCAKEDKALSFDQMYILNKDGHPQPTKFMSTPAETVAIDEYSPDMKHRVVFRSVEKNYEMEIYADDRIIFKKKLENLHGPIAVANLLNAKPIMFNKEGTKFLYLAEEKPAKTDIWADEFARSNLETNNYKPNFGENLEDFSYPRIFFVDIEKQTVLSLKGIPKDLLVISAAFLQEAQTTEKPRLYITGYDYKRYVSGLGLCLNKPSGIYILEDYELIDLFPKDKPKLETKDKKEETSEVKARLTKLSEQFPIAHFPSSSPSGARVMYFFSRHHKETHLFQTGLAVTDLLTMSTEVVIDSVESEGKRALYTVYDSHRHVKWLSEEEVAFPSYDLGRFTINIVNLNAKSWKQVFLTKNFPLDGFSILDWNENLLTVALSNFYHRSLVGVVHSWSNWKNSDFSLDDIKWEPITTVQEDSEHRLQEGEIEEILISVRDITGYIWRLKDFKDEAGNSVSQNKRPLYIHFHGGPHYFQGAAYSTLLLMLLRRGYQVMTLNFSGSWSFGEHINERATGQVGMVDIQELIDWMSANKDMYDPSDVTFDGGSYSGLQSIVLLQKHHVLFKNIIAYNPVVNMVGMQFQTDIPEWTWVEGLGVQKKFDITEDLSDSELLKLKELSPGLQAFDPQTKTKTLFIIGDKDRRVPPPGSLYLYRKLKAIGLDVRCVTYKDQGHGIRKPKFVMDYIMNMLDLVMDFNSQEASNKPSETSKSPEETDKLRTLEEERDALLKEIEKLKAEKGKTEETVASTEIVGDPTSTLV